MACEYLYEGKWYTEEGLREVSNQRGGAKTAPSAASPATMKKIREFLDRIGVEVQSLSKITYNGNALGVNGIADPLRGLIQVIEGKEDTVLPEEAMHMAVELIEQQDPALFKQMMDRIGRYDLFDRVMLEYQGNLFYQTKEGRPDVRKIKKEAIGKVLAQTVIDKNQGATEKPELLNQTRTWWERIIDFLKKLFLKAEFNPFQEAATQVLSGKLEGQVSSGGGLFASRNPNAVNATLKLVSSLRDPRAAKWFKSLDKVTFMQKLQTDLQAPKAQVEMLRKWMQGKEFDSIGDIIAGVMSELSYAVEVNVSMQRLDNNDMRNYEDFIIDGETYHYEFITFEKVRETDEPSGMDEFTKNGESISKEEYGRAYKRYREVNAEMVPSQAYVDLNVPGGVNYRNSEIKTPGITPSIKGHAEFATDQGIGWFRSDEVGKDYKEYNTYEEAERRYGSVDVNTPSGEFRSGSKTRRILEIQSDLFQKGREAESLVSVYTNEFVANYRNQIKLDEKTDEYYAIDKDGNFISPGYRTKQSAIEWWEKRLMKEGINPSKNDFLQLLNKENNWVTFFVKAIIQDSAKKNYEKVRFPGGNTANKIEGQETIEEFIQTREEGIEQGRRDLEEMNAELDKITREENRWVMKDRIQGVEKLIIQFERELQDAREGRHKFVTIANFYETTIQNILKKQGYKPSEVTDEYGNKWFEIEIKPTRDLGEFYFQISGPQDIADNIAQKDANITKTGTEYQINGNRIRRSIQQEILDFYKKRLGAQAADKALKGFKQETEGKVQVDIKDIFNRYIDDDYKLRVTPLSQTNPSAVDPNDNSMYMTIESYIRDLLNTYEPGTQFLHSVNLYDGLNTAGRADFVAITPQGQVDVMQFKVPQVGQGATDIPVYRQEAYNLEIEQLRRILQVGYNVPRSSFRKTRAIPIKAEYQRVAPGISDLRLSKLTIGNVNVALIKDNLLLPIASESETSENEKFDEYITRLRALAQKLSSERVSPDKRQERNQKVAELVGAIRKLQIKKDGTAIVKSAQAIIKSSKEKISSLRDKISNTDPNVATIEELNKIAEEILSDRDQIELYRDLYSVYKSVFVDNTVESEEIIKDARAVSDAAGDLSEEYLNLSVSFRTKKFAAKVGIKDEFTPEKRLTWYRRMIRSLSQSSIKAGAELWRLVERINNGFKLEFLKRLDELGTIEKEVSTWMKGKPIQELYKKIFQYDAQGRWNGRIVQMVDRNFYSELKKAQENRDEKWIKENIDIDAYNAWFKENHQRRIDNAKTARYVADDAENAKIVQQKLQEFVDTFHIGFKKGIGTYNWALANHPKVDKWKSAEYQELENIEITVDGKKVKPLLKLYEYYRKRLKESWDLGMLQEHSGWSWFPNVRRGLLEKLSTAPAGNKLSSLFGSIRIDAEDQVFGKIDPLTGKPVDEVHANFVTDLGEWVSEADSGYWDYSEKSMDIFKVISLWDSEIIKYKLRTESEGIARLLHYTETQRKAYESTPTGKLRKTPEGKPIPISNEVNSAYIKEFLDAVYYGKSKSNEFDVVLTVPYKSMVQKVNKLFGSEILSVPKEDDVQISGIKVIETMNRYFVTKTLGLNVMTSIAQLFGGTTNAAINQGKYFNKKDMMEAELKYVGGRFYTSEQDKKLAGLISYIHPFTEDRTSAMVRKLSVSKMVEYLSSDHLFFLQRGSDNWVDSVIAMSVIKNTMIHDGKLVNIRDFVRKELGHANKYSGTYEEQKEFDKRLEGRVAELQKSPQALVNYAQIVNDELVLPNLERTSDTVISLRQSILEIIKDALGNTSTEDLSLYKRQIMWQSFFMFKNWIPRMADVRFQSLKYSPGTDQYEYGRMRMLWNAVFSKNTMGVKGLIKMLGNSNEPLIETAKKEYKKKREAFAEQMEDLEMTEAQFVDMYIKGVRSEMKELMLAAGLMGILISMRVMAPEGDDDPEFKGAYRWALRGLDKLTDELTFMYTPTSFTSILNGSVFPAVGILVEFERFFTTAIKKIFWTLLGDEEKAEKQHLLKYVARSLPITKEAIQYLAIFNDDIAREYGIRMNTNYGSVR